jgi:hypothetical protein
MWLES